MADVATYLTELESKSFIHSIGTPEEKPNAGNTELDLKAYIVPVMEKVGTEKAAIVKHAFYVYNEGGGQETAFGPYVPKFIENDSVYQAIVSYVQGIAGVRAYWIKEYSKDNNYAKVRIDQYVTDHIEEKWILIWNDGGLTHAEITTLV